MKLEFSRQILKKILNNKVFKTRLVETVLLHADKVTDGQTGGHGKANSQISKLCERA